MAMKIPTLLLIVSVNAIVVYVVVATIFLFDMGNIPLYASLWIRTWPKARSTYDHSMTTIIANHSMQEVKHQRGDATKYLIHTCINHCGGFADRMRGIVALYLLSIKHKRKFGIYHLQPCHLRNVLVPSEYNWTIGDEMFLENSSRYDDLAFSRDFYGQYNGLLNKDVVFMQSNAMPNNLQGHFKKVFLTLFKPSEAIQKEINEFKQKHVGRNKLVCSHIRVGKNPSMEDVHYNDLGNISAIWQFLKRYDKVDHVIYIASDSDAVKEAAKLKFSKRLVDIPGRIMHIDIMADDEDCSGFRKVVLDFYVLSTCDVLLVTRSGFGRLASYLRDKTSGLFCVRDRKVEKCKHYNARAERVFEKVDIII